MAQAAVCHSPHRLPILLMGAYIGVTGRPAGADIQIAPPVNGIRPIDGTGRPADGRGAAIRAFQVIFFHGFHWSTPFLPSMAVLLVSRILKAAALMGSLAEFQQWAVCGRYGVPLNIQAVYGFKGLFSQDSPALFRFDGLPRYLL